MKIRKCIHNGREKWEVDAGKWEGKRRRFRFDTMKAAEKKREELISRRNRSGDIWDDMPERRKVEIVSILEEMDSRGVTLREVWNHFQKGGKTIKSKPLKEAVNECLVAKLKANRRPKYLAELENTLCQFADPRAVAPVHSISVSDIDDFINAVAADSTKASRRSRMSTFFKWAIRQGYCFENPVSATEAISVDYGEPEILTVEQCKSLLNAAVKIDSGAVPELTMRLFVGVRANEVAGLEWSDVNLARKTLRIFGQVAKTRTRRVVQMEAAAVAWLRAYRTQPLTMSVNRRRRMDAIKAKAGIDYWPGNCLRHTATSHLFALHGASKAAKELGTSEAMLFRHYREIVTPTEAKKFWKIRPLR